MMQFTGEVVRSFCSGKLFFHIHQFMDSFLDFLYQDTFPGFYNFNALLLKTGI